LIRFSWSRGYVTHRACAALHVDLAIPNFGVQEYMGHRAETGEVFGTGYFFAGGWSSC